MTDTNQNYYDDRIVKKFLTATMVWGAVALLLGLYIALEMANYKFNLNLKYITFSRLRPLHTNAAIFAFAGNAIFAGIYYSTQRLLKVRMFSDWLSKIHFWGWQLIILSAALTLPFGITQSKEYAELEWPIDIAITLIWVVFAVNFFGSIVRRREKHLYVAIWFYIATIITVAVLHIVNSLVVPVSLTQSYPIFAGAQDALVQWWYGHNAVAFFLTTPFLGLMYYFIPKAANRPIYSYQLSIVHFWSLVFIYIWAGPHHLLYTALPEWAQTLGMVFSLMLWAPSWGGMVNGLLTLRGQWDLVRRDPILKFLAAAVTFYGMATFEGPLLSIKSVNALAHYTDWIIAHVHMGALGWNGFLTFGMVYYLVPKLWKVELHSVKWANYHFWLGTLGIVFYAMSMWAAGITQGLMWQGIDDSGRLLYPDFVETVLRIVPLYWVRAFGGALYLVGFILMMVNICKTVAASNEKDVKVEVPAASPMPKRLRFEGFATVFSVMVLVSVLVGSVFELLPTFMSHSYVDVPNKADPYSPLQLAGRDIYVKEGCYVCHSQMVRPMMHETLRYGPPSELGDSFYDRPFQWGSKRTGPDLAYVGGKYPDLWHFRHMIDPRSTIPKSIMPGYPWLAEDKIDFKILTKKFEVLKMLGVPYTEEQVASAPEVARQEAQKILENLRANGVTDPIEEANILALIAYLQRLGQK